MQTVLIHPGKCVGCRHCEVACVLEHSRHYEIISYALGEKDSQPRLKVQTGVDFIPFPNRCRHCRPAPCEQACPSGAIYRNEDTGAILLDPKRCISCWMCVMLCPFCSMMIKKQEARSGKESAFKCDACADRLREFQPPACVLACKTGALEFGYTDDLLASGQQAAAVDRTLIAQGMEAETLPENLRFFRAVQKSLAELGPMPASRDFLETHS
ncbi:MAG: hypothetical protein KGY41_02540 [Desulfovermiculus sp.]|nr:hypothetical protein [Desulfovermiculus sp.]